MKLEINEEKTKIYDLTKEKMKYLGYDFYVFKRNSKCVQQNGKYQVSNSLPKSKEDEITEKCKILLRAIKESPTLEAIHAWNTYVVGIHNYYRGMNRFSYSFQKIGWRIRKLFYHTMNQRIKFTTEQSYKDSFQNGVYSSWGRDGYYCLESFPVFEIQWANWNSNLIAAFKGRVARENPYGYGERKHKPGVSMEDINYLVQTSKSIKSSRYAMFRISKYSSMKGISYLSGSYVLVEQYYCHHIVSLINGGTNDFNNLCVLSETEHQILHSNNPELLYSLFPKRTKRIKVLIDALYGTAV